MAQAICIYCLQQKPIAQFNREHVVPLAFGRFEGNLTLDREVCRDCNDHFGRTLDQILSRGSLQGVVRYLKGMKPLTELSKANPTRVDIHLASDDPLTADEVEFVKTEAGEGVRCKAGLKYWSVTRNKLEFISLRKLESKESDLLNDLDRSQSVIVVRSCEDELERLEKALKELKLGITIDATTTEELHPREKVRVAFDVIEDDTNRRAIAKIAFNYIAKTQRVGFTLDEGFNPIRRFIRFGEYSDRKFVRRIDSLPIYEGGTEARKRGGHHIQCDLAPTGKKIIGWITLFQVVSYQVSFGKYRGVLPARLASGSYFDVVSKKVIPVQAITRPPALWLPPSRP